jgi:nitrite reductase (NADH) small subunit
MNAPLHQWLDVGRLSDIPRRGARQVVTPWLKLALFRTADDRVFALEDRCPHLGGALSQGIVHGVSVTCPLHSYVIGLETGMVQAPDQGCVRTLPVRQVEGRLLLGLPPATSAED